MEPDNSIDPANYLDISIKDSLIHAKFVKEAPETKNHILLAKYYQDTILDIYNKNSEKSYVVLLDLKDVGHSNNASVSTARYYDKITTHKQTKKVAVVGNSKLEQLVINILFSRLKEKKANWFVDREKALRWLGIKTD